ncbi:hypothetical protein ACI2VT_16570 [Ralstonia nicotianae]|nr:hypothetical protein MAFF241648_14290 [Ralstonia solanacearum]
MDKAKFFDAAEAKVLERPVPVIADMMKFRVMTGTARDEFHRIVEAGDKTASHFEAALVVATVVNDDHSPMFTADDVQALRERDANALTAVAQIAMQVNKIGVKAEAEAAKN